MDLDWFAIRVKSNFEKHVSRALSGKGFEEYLPVYRRAPKRGHRPGELEMPLFPGYVFGRFAVNRRLPILTIPGVYQIVGVGGVPVPVDPAELATVRALLESGAGAEPWPFVRTGQRVLIHKGPLRGIEALVVASKKNFRLVASLTLLQRSVSVEIERDWVRGISDGRDPLQSGTGRHQAAAGQRSGAEFMPA
jgi:transcription antitermination factor NusG